MKKSVKPKFEAMDLSNHFVDCWRLFRSSMITHPWLYPSTAETHEEEIRADLFAQMKQPNFFGLMAKIGRKPVGQIIGTVCVRPFGNPKVYFYIYNCWLEPEHQKKGIIQEMWPIFTAALREKGIYHWESNVFRPELADFLLKSEKHPTKVLSQRIGGSL